MNKKLIIIIVSVLLTWHLSFGQKRDYRGQLIPDGRVTELSISTDEKLWIGTYLGGLYYSDSFDSTWKICNSSKIFSFSVDDEYANKPNIDRISFFNSQQAIMTGYISLEKWGDKNGIYQTNDGGKTWTSIDFNGDMWVYDAFVNNQGQAWIVGSSGRLHYSSDFGRTWRLAPSLKDIKKDRRTSTVYMTDSLNGYIGIFGKVSKSDEIYLYHTKDNWKTFEKLKTPSNLNLLEAGSKDFTVNKIFVWDGKLAIRQGKEYFYSDRNKIEWKKINLSLLDISYNSKSEKLYGITESLDIVEFRDFENYSIINEDFVKRNPKTFKSINNWIYILDEDNELYKINTNKAKSTLLYSNDIQISQPVVQDSYDDTKAGVEGKQILLFDNQKNKWYRAGTVDFYIHDFYLKNKTEAILWAGYNSYLYNLTNNQIEIFKYEKPLNEFLSSNIAEVTINCGRSCGYGGCHGVRFDQITYKKRDSLLFCDKYIVFSVGELGANRKEKKKKYKSSFREANLSLALEGVNEDPYLIPAVRDFEIKNTDKLFNAEKVKQINSKSQKEDFDKTVLDLDLYLNETVDKIIKQNESVLWSTCNEWFAVTLINESADTLTFRKQYYADSKVYHFPWTVNYKGRYFTSYSLDFSLLINAILPEKFRGKEYFDNNVLLIELNDYLNQ